jgi:T5SS/PEP-CTERM-associated repeat protein
MKFSRFIVTFIVVLITTISAHAGIYIWDGGSPTFNWIDANENWDHDVAPPSNLLTSDLVFAGVVHLNVGGLFPYSVHSISFNASAGAFTIEPAPLSIGTGGIENDSTSKMHFNTPISFSDVPNATIDAVNGSIAFDQSVTLPSGTLTVHSTSFSANTSFTKILGASTINKTGPGSMDWYPSSTVLAHVIVSAGDLGMLGTISTSSTIDVNGTALFHADDDLVLNGTNITRATNAAITIAADKTLTLQNGGIATITGSFTNSTPSTLAISDTGTAFNVSSTLTLNAGSITTVSAGAALTAQTLVVASSSDATMTITGSGSSLQTNSVSVGLSGSHGTLSIKDHSTATLGAISVDTSGTTGTNGLLAISGGARVTGTNLNIATNTAANTGNVTVSQTGSRLLVTGTTNIGAASGSTGALTISTGGTFNTGTALTTVNSTGEIIINGGTLIANGTVQFRKGAGLAVLSGGKFDLRNQQFDGQQADLGTWDGTKFTGMMGLVQSGYNGGTWDGPGVMTSAGTSKMGLGIAPADKIGLAGGTFGGVSVGANDVLIGYTLMGDSDIDGDVDFADLVKVAQHYGQTGGKYWYEGNFNYDDNVGFADLVKVAQNYGMSLPAAALVEVPEPSAITLATLGLIIALRRPNRYPRPSPNV